MAKNEVKGQTQEVTRYIKREVERELWARAAGRCEFQGCNTLLYRSPVTQERVNISEKAHIYSFSEAGPRGWGPFKKNPEDLNNIDNLMLMCNGCHTTIDQDKTGSKYSADLLQQWKQSHENRVVTVTGMTSNRKSHVIFYGSNIGEQKSIIQKSEAIDAMFPERYPAEERPIVLSMICSHRDNSPEFWVTESKHLESKFLSEINRRIEDETTSAHFSVFALAPVPLLIKLGTLLTDKIDVDVYQPIREPKTWKWQEFPEGFEFIVKEPTSFSNPPVLVISLTDKISYDRIYNVLGKEICVWELTVMDEYIGNDTIREKAQLSLMRTVIRKLMVQIKEKHGFETPLRIFPAMAVSLSIEMGRARMPKADMPWIIYDQNNDLGSFIEALNIGGGKS